VLHILRDEPFKNAVNMPAVPSDVLNKLEPYFALGEKMGSFLAQITEGAIREIDIRFSGDLVDVDTSHLVRHIVKGVLSLHFGSDVNIVNALHLAKTRDVNIVRQKSSETKGFTNLITLTLKTKNEEHSLSGTLLNGYGARIVKIDQYSVDVDIAGNLILVSHTDKPGIIGKMGTLLGNNEINIATMQVGRQIVGGAAIMVLSVDKQPAPEVIKELAALPEIKSVKEITL
jgi:D-3-phosphoglycerate dehydrogenase